MKPLIAVALSGGVDSMMAAIFLKEQGHKIIGIHFITGYETDFKPNAGELAHESIEDQARRRIALIGDQLNIPIEVFNCRKEFQEKVVDYFTHTYQIGQTPNPCLVCNPLIKFGTVLNLAQQLGADQLATGHYARIVKDPKGNIHLLRGVDLQKDQSYFLARLTPGRCQSPCPSKRSGTDSSQREPGCLFHSHRSLRKISCNAKRISVRTGGYCRS